MTIRDALVNGTLFVLLGAGSGASTWWVLTRAAPGTARPASASIPAKIGKVLKEDQINTITLPPEALRVLKLGMGKVERKPVQASRLLGAEVTIPTGHLVTVSAPLGGTLKVPAAGMPQPGQAVTRGKPILELMPLLTPEGKVNLTTTRIEAEGQVETTAAALAGARIALERARRLLRGEAGSQRGVDEAQAQFDVAKKAADAATARRTMLRKVTGDLEKGTSAPLVLEAPENGILRNLLALPGQNVPAGAPLFEVIDLERVWLRVPVFVGDLASIDPAATALITSLTASPGRPGIPALEQPSRVVGLIAHPKAPGLTAAPILAPPSANAAAGTVDLFYDLDNRVPGFRPGQRVGISIPLQGTPTSLTVPWSAVLIDLFGGTWIYEQTAEDTFLRRRVLVRFVQGATAVLDAGPPPGTVVVTDGAAELFGTETGFSK